jgi:two-component system, LytTR family, response regulator
METPRLRALLVDDEELARENLRMMLADECPEVTIIGTANGPTLARQRISELDPDLLFLDIRMPSGTEGLDLLEAMPDARFMVIFVTAFKDYAVQAFHSNAVDYVLKPIDPDELRAAVSKAQTRWELMHNAKDESQRYRNDLNEAVRTIKLHGSSPRLAVDHAKGFKLFEPHTIARLEADGNCTLLHFTDGGRYLDTRTLKIYEDMLDPLQFLRVHRSHLINIDHLREYLREDGHWAVMKDGARVPIARERVQAFVEATRG